MFFQEGSGTLLGHNFSLSHAPCGGISGDPYFTNTPLPWPNSNTAVVTSAPLYDQINNRLINPLSGGTSAGVSHDVMGYCGGIYFSEYSYKKMADYIESQSTTLYGAPMALVKAAAIRASAGTALNSQAILVQGHISPEGVVYLKPMLTFSRTQVESAQGPYQISLYSSNGSVVSTRFSANKFDHDTSGNLYFTAVLPWLADITRVAVVQEGQKILPIAPPNIKPSLSKIASTSGKIYVTPEITEASQKVTVRWDAARHPWLSLIYIAPSGQRNTLIVNAAGGVASASTQGLPAGGQWEVARSNGLNTVLEKHSRQ